MALIKTNARSASALDATILTGNIPALNGSAVTNLTSGNLTGALPAISGASLTTLNATNISSGTLNAARYSGGKLLQTVTGTLDGIVTTTSTTFADTGLDADITLATTGSKVLIQATLVSAYNNATNNQGMFRIMRDDSTNLTPSPDSGEQGHIGVIYCPGEKINSTINFMFEDSPSSTSALNYSIYFACQDSGSMRINQNGQRSYIHLMEIGA
jgi:hypothetical protein